jgi:hypothetical protein
LTSAENDKGDNARYADMVKTTCKDIEPIMIGYVSGEILQSQKRLLDEHISVCDDCADEIVKLQRLDLNLIELRDEESTPPDELKSAILSELSFKRRPGYHRVLSSTSILSVVTVVLAVLVFVMAGKVDKISSISDAPQSKMVKVMFLSDDAKKVSLVGDFNGWGVEPVLLKSVQKGTWEAELELSPGMYQYNLLVDGKKWVANPNSRAQVPDGFGGTNSVMIVNGGSDANMDRIGKNI